MLVLKSFLRYWGPVVAWMALIFTGSSDADSGPRSSRILGPLLRWLFPQLPPADMDFWITLLRKCAHGMEYAILALLVWRALDRPQAGQARPWNRAHAGYAFAAACLYAASDEIHQIFVPTRQASVRDVLIDSAGAAAALFALWCWRRWRAAHHQARQSGSPVARPSHSPSKEVGGR